MRQHLNGIFLLSLLGLSAATAVFAQDPPPSLRFSGYADADFISNINDPSSTSGLEIDLTTTVTFNPRLNAVLYTTMTDGIVPAQGAGTWTPPVLFDGVALNWMYDDKLTIHAGDLIYGTGYFNYYLHKRAAVVVGEHTVRGAGFTRGPLTVTTGMESANSWSTFAKYDFSLGDGMSLTPSAKHTFLDGASPVIGGLSFQGDFGDFDLKTDAAFNYYNGYNDPGYTLLVEPSYSRGKYSVAGAIFFNEKGAFPSPNVPTTTLPSPLADTSAAYQALYGGKSTFDDFFVYVEPGVSFSKTYAFGLPVEYHIPDLDTDAGSAVWLVPTFYIYPGSGVQWWIWAQGIFYAGGADPAYYAGSEIIFNF